MTYSQLKVPGAKLVTVVGKNIFFSFLRRYYCKIHFFSRENIKLNKCHNLKNDTILYFLLQLHFVVRHGNCSLAKSSAPREEKDHK